MLSRMHADISTINEVPDRQREVDGNCYLCERLPDLMVVGTVCPILDSYFQDKIGPEPGSTFKPICVSL